MFWRSAAGRLGRATRSAIKGARSSKAFVVPSQISAPQVRHFESHPDLLSENVTQPYRLRRVSSTEEHSGAETLSQRQLGALPAVLSRAALGKLLMAAQQTPTQQMHRLQPLKLQDQLRQTHLPAQKVHQTRLRAQAGLRQQRLRRLHHPQAQHSRTSQQRS